jgi:hypothetical protein
MPFCSFQAGMLVAVTFWRYTFVSLGALEP